MATETTTTTETLTSPIEETVAKIKHIVKADTAATTKQRIRTVLELDPKFESLCFDVTKYQPMINGDIIQTSDLLTISSYLTDSYRREVCTFTGERANDLSISTTVKESVVAVAHQNKFNPRTKYILDCYDKHGDSGVPLLNTWLERVGCTIDDDKKPLLSALGRKFLVQTVARVFHPGVQADMGLILHDPVGDKAKSKFWRTLAVKSEWINESGVGDLKDEKKMGELLAPYWYVTFDENSSLTRTELGALKKMWTLTKDTYRTAWDIAVSDKLRQCVFGGTTNILKLFLDEGGIARRFPVIDVTEADTEWLKENRDQLYAAAFHVYRQNFKNGVLTFHPEVEHGYDPVKFYNDDYLPDDERIKANVHWWFSEKHEPKLYAMLSELSLRTLVTLGWQEELEYHLTFLVGQKVATRHLKELLGPNTKATEDQIGRYLGSKGGLHTPFAKVSYTPIDRDHGMRSEIRLSGWLIGSNEPEPTKPSFMQKKIDAKEKAEAKAEASAQAPLVLTAKDVKDDFQKVMASSVGEDDPFMDPSAWSFE
jgi:Virulence-associated protein E